MTSLLGLLLLHGGGAFLRTGLGGRSWRRHLRSPASFWWAAALLYGFSLGVPGRLALIALGFGLLMNRSREATPELARGCWVTVGVFALVVFARPWVPTQWDEFVWLGKARLEALGFGTGARFALDPAQHLVPSGYPPLWPSLVGWLGMGTDSLEAQVVASSLLVVVAAATALEAWQKHLRRATPWWLIAVLVTPLFWVHARSAYVDLPVGLLALALLGSALNEDVSLATVLAVILCALKDEGLAYVIAITVATGPPLANRPLKHLAPGLAGALTAIGWRVLTHQHDIVNDDHALSTPQLSWLLPLGRLLLLHASDLASWGAFWAVAAVSVVRPAPEPITRALRWALVISVGLSALALLCGPPQVRSFAQNGTLLNRLLMQWWPMAAMLVVLTQPASVSNRGVGIGSTDQ